MPSNKVENTNYFVFSIEYLVLVSVIYASLILCPLLFMANDWFLFFGLLTALLACIALLRYILNEYFIARNTSKQFADLITIVSIFPPVIGPIIVLNYTLTPPVGK